MKFQNFLDLLYKSKTSIFHFVKVLPAPTGLHPLIGFRCEKWSTPGVTARTRPIHPWDQQRTPCLLQSYPTSLVGWRIWVSTVPLGAGPGCCIGRHFGRLPQLPGGLMLRNETGHFG